jgi:TonB family protein
MTESSRSHLSFIEYLSVAELVCVTLFIAQSTRSFASDWVNQSKPSFPTAALERNSEGVVKLRIVVKKDGSVDHAVVARSSGEHELDDAAKRGVLSWRIKRGAIKPADLSQGREVLIDFREEAAVAARYPDRVVASFDHAESAAKWRSAPFPPYPMEARMSHEEGTVVVQTTIGVNGNVERVEILQSSGHEALDDSAINAVQHWKAHPRYAGQSFKFPITFKLTRR